MSNTVLKVEGLRKEFGGLVAVNDVSFEIGEGEFVGLIGPNGCGKSTTFNCISGLLNQTRGSVEMFGEDVSDLRPDQRIRALLVPDSNPEEVERLEKAYSVLDQLEVPHMAHNLTSELSGGQSKLVDIGRSMMGEPKILLLDEPVAGVAGPLAMKIFNNLRNIVDETGISVLIIEHNMDFILRQGVDRIIVMNEGEVLMQGTPDEVRGNREVIEAYLGASGEPLEEEE